MREHRVPDSLADAPVVGASGRAYRVDNLWPGQKLIVEVDGREWHLSPDHWERDLERAADLIDAGYTVLRFTAAAIRRRTVQTVAVVARQLGRAAGPGV
jgi:very-short-patch-repair endonuclease